MTVLQGLSGTAQGTFSIHQDSCKYPCDIIPYNDVQDARCLDCLRDQLYKDSIICENENKISFRDSIIVQDSVKFDAISVEYEFQKELATDNAKKLNNCRKWSKIKSTASMIGGAFIGWIVRKTIVG